MGTMTVDTPTHANRRVVVGAARRAPVGREPVEGRVPESGPIPSTSPKADDGSFAGDVEHLSSPPNVVFRPSPPHAVQILHGRQRERREIESVVAGALVGHGGALVVRGTAGIGKTALLDDVVEACPGLRVVRAAGASSERELPYALLHQLCGWLVTRLDRLPAPQAEAVGAILGERVGLTPDAFLVGLGVLGLLREAAADQPLCLVIEEAHLVDPASLKVLTFVARRVNEHSVVVLFSTRTALRELVDLPELELAGLDERDARLVLGSVVPGHFDRAVANRIIAETRGNPRALRDTAGGRQIGELAGGFGFPDGAISDSTAEWFAQRVRHLPQSTQLLLLLAAADATGDADLLWRSATRLGSGIADAETAEAEGLLQIGDGATFCDPRMRSAVYWIATAEQRRRVHRVLAEMTDTETNPDRRAWHLAKATSGTDQQIADDLECSAERARRRGGPAASGAFLELAAQLSTDSSSRARLQLASAREKFDAGAVDAAISLVEDVDVTLLGPGQGAELESLRVRVAHALRQDADAPGRLAAAARRLEPLSIPSARRTYLQAFAAAMTLDGDALGRGLQRIGSLARMAPASSDSRDASDVLLDGLARQATDGYATGLAELRGALTRFGAQEPSEAALDVLSLVNRVAMNLWDDEAWVRLSASSVEFARRTGSLRHLRSTLDAFAAASIAVGDFTTAGSAIDEGEAIDAATKTAPISQSQWLLAAWRGEEVPVLRETLLDPGADGPARRSQADDYAAALLYNALGRYDDARRVALRASIPANALGLSLWALPELIESAFRSGEFEMAEAALAQLRETTRLSSSDWALGVDALYGALLRGDDADAFYREAISRLAKTKMRTQLARAHLLYGEWLRRARQRVDAREHLRIASDMFSAMGAAAFARRARRELAATGEKARARTPGPSCKLTPKEGQIAHMAAEGLSNGEIAGQLYLSPRTVEYHLHKIFMQLGISSRNQLHRALEALATSAPATLGS